METERLSTILEGGCPECSGDLKLTAIGGKKSFLAEYPAKRGVNRTVWSKESDAVGSLTQECTKCHKEFYVEQNRFGDWA